MCLREHRKGRTGIFTAIALMVSIVLFMGINFYLTTTGPWDIGQLFGRKKDDTPPISEKQTETQPQIDQQELNLTMAVADLENEGCVFVVYTREYTSSDVIRLEYYAFREKAINRKIVFFAEEQYTTILLIEKKGQLYKWSP